MPMHNVWPKRWLCFTNRFMPNLTFKPIFLRHRPMRSAQIYEKALYNFDKIEPRGHIHKTFLRKFVKSL